MSGLLEKMLTGEEESVKTSPEDVDPGQEDRIVFFRDFDNPELSAQQRMAALEELVKLIRG